MSSHSPWRLLPHPPSRGDLDRWIAHVAELRALQPTSSAPSRLPPVWELLQGVPLAPALELARAGLLSGDDALTSARSTPLLPSGLSFNERCRVACALVGVHVEGTDLMTPLQKVFLMYGAVLDARAKGESYGEAGQMDGEREIG